MSEQSMQTPGTRMEVPGVTDELGLSERRAPDQKFRLIFTDTNTGKTYVVRDFAQNLAAQERARTLREQARKRRLSHYKYNVYDDHGEIKT